MEERRWLLKDVGVLPSRPERARRPRSAHGEDESRKSSRKKQGEVDRCAAAPENQKTPLNLLLCKRKREKLRRRQEIKRPLLEKRYRKDERKEKPRSKLRETSSPRPKGKGENLRKGADITKTIKKKDGCPNVSDSKQ